MTTKNPFEIFGLTPELVASLSERDLFAVLKAMYRSLQKTVHPDVVRRKSRPNGPQQAVELNLAFEALNLDKNQADFRRHRKSFVARRPRTAYLRSLTLQKELEAQAAKEDRLATAYLNRLVADYGWADFEMKSSAEENPNQGATISMPLKNVRLGLLDVAINQNLKMASWSLGSNYKEMDFDADGGMAVRQVGRSNFAPAAYIHLLGSVPADQVELMPLLDRPPARFFKTPALNASIGANGPALSVMNRIQASQFKAHVLVHLRPEVTERSYLFSLNRAEYPETGCLSLEGLVVKIEKSPPIETSL